MKLFVIKAENVRKLVSMNKAIEALRNIFLLHTAKQLIFPTRNIFELNNPGSLALIMPSYNSSSDLLGVKLSTIVPSNNVKNLPLIHSLMVIVDGSDGQIKALADGSEITKLRTGAICGLSTTHLSNQSAKNLAIIGAGKQSYSIAEAICSIRNITKVTLYSKTLEKTQRLKNYIKDNFQISDVVISNSASMAIKDADIICTATSNTTCKPVFDLNDLPDDKEILINAIGGASLNAFELPPELYLKANIVVEDPDAASNECGEIKHNITNMQIAKSDLMPLGQIIKNGFNLKHKITIFRSVGMAIEDLAIIQEILNSKHLESHCPTITMD